MRCNDLSANSERVPSNPGTKEHIRYEAKVNKDGSIDLIVVGKEDTDQIIESFRESTELATIIARYENGDFSALNTKEGFYADVLNAPKTLPDAIHYVLAAEAAFDALPLDSKKMYGNNYRAWLADVGSDEWMKSIGQYTEPEPKPEKESEE